MFCFPEGSGASISNGTNTELTLVEVDAPPNVCVSICKVTVFANIGIETTTTDNEWKIRLVEESVGSTKMIVNYGASVNNGGEILSRSVPSYLDTTVVGSNLGTVVRVFDKIILNENFAHYEWRATDADDMIVTAPGNIFAVTATPGQDTTSDIFCTVFWIE